MGKTGRKRLSRWRRSAQERHVSARRMILGGAVIGVSVALASIAMLDVHLYGYGSLGLVRLALLLPAATFIIWWLVGPGWAATPEEEFSADTSTVDVDAIREKVLSEASGFNLQSTPVNKLAEGRKDIEWFRSSMKRSELPIGVSSDPKFWGLNRETKDDNARP